MSAHLRFLCAVILINYSVATVNTSSAPAPAAPKELDKKIELTDGVRLGLPKNDSRRVLSFEIDTTKTEGRSKQSKLLEKLLPLFIMPFILQSTIVPMFLSVLKFMLFKSFMVGKLALTLIMFNAFKNHNVVKGRDAIMANVVYGYQGNGMEYGAYIP